MSKTLQSCIKYTTKELEHYTKLDGSCVKKVNTKWHLLLPPFALKDIRQYITTYIRSKKVGFYDMHINGIILDVKNIKLLGSSAALRSDDPRMHVKIIADCFVFQPIEGAILSGIVRHVGKKHVGALIYRVFNANLRFETKVNENLVALDKKITFRVNNFNLQNVFPYIEGDLIMKASDGMTNSHTKFDIDSPVDSGIEEKETNDIDRLHSLVKQEPMSEAESNDKSIKKQSEKRKSIKRKTAELTNPETPVKKSKKNISNETLNEDAQSKSIKKKIVQELKKVIIKKEPNVE